jgi:hypothetical protein
MFYELLRTLPSQELYGMEINGNNYLTENNRSILYHQYHITDKEDEFAKEFSTTHNPVVNVNHEFWKESSTIHNATVNGDAGFPTVHNSIVNGDRGSSSGFSTIQNPAMKRDRESFSEISTIYNPIVKPDNEFSSRFSTIQAVKHTDESHLRSKEIAETVRSQESQLISDGSFNRTPSSIQDETKENFSNIVNIIEYFTGDSSNYNSQVISKNLINFACESIQCRSDYLFVGFEYLKKGLLQYIKHLTNQRALKLSDTVHLIRDPVADTR